MKTLLLILFIFDCFNFRGNIQIVPVNPVAGDTLHLSIAVQGGTPPYTYQWYDAYGDSSSVADPLHPLPASVRNDVYGVSCFLTDNDGCTYLATNNFYITDSIPVQQVFNYDIGNIK